ncbi:MAG: sigma-70 family RNA polymerase sigma factor [Myxococcota bacterium]
MDDDHALGAWAAGDVEAGRVLYERYGDRVARFFTRQLPPDEATDLVQQTFFKALEAVRQGHRVTHVAGWLFGIARNALYDALRAKARDRTFEPARTSLAEVRTGPVTALTRHESQRHLLAALERLPADDQIALELFYWQDLSMADVAVAMGISRSAAINRVYRARKALRQRLSSKTLRSNAVRSVPEDEPC